MLRSESPRFGIESSPLASENGLGAVWLDPDHATMVGLPAFPPCRPDALRAPEPSGPRITAIYASVRRCLTAPIPTVSAVPEGRAKWILAAALLAVFVGSLDLTVIATLLPRMVT